MSVVMSNCFYQCWCCHQCQRGILLDNWFGKLVFIDVKPWKVILDIDLNPLRLISTLGEVQNPQSCGRDRWTIGYHLYD